MTKQSDAEWQAPEEPGIYMNIRDGQKRASWFRRHKEWVINIIMAAVAITVGAIGFFWNDIANGQTDESGLQCVIEQSEQAWRRAGYSVVGIIAPP